MENEKGRFRFSPVGKLIRSLSGTVMILLLLATQVAAHPVRPIRFRFGATEATVAGRLRGQNDIACCV